MVNPLARATRGLRRPSLDARSWGSTTPPFFKRVGGDRPLPGLSPLGMSILPQPFTFHLPG
jgi:hypothetical protein